MRIYPLGQALTFGAALFFLSDGLRAQATLTTLALYNFENQSSASAFFGDASGNGRGMVNATGISSTSVNLASTGGSSAFDGAGDGKFAWQVGNSSVGQSTNWGFELLFKNPGSSNSSEPVTIFSVGHPDTNGMAILYDPVSNRVTARLNPTTAVGTATFEAGQWNSAAVVNDGTTTTLWVNYASAASITANPVAPDVEWHMFVNPGGGTKYAGLADNLRVFTFTGTFTAANLSAGGAVPEPSTYATLAGAACLAAAVVTRRRRRHLLGRG